MMSGDLRRGYIVLLLAGLLALFELCSCSRGLARKAFADETAGVSETSLLEVVGEVNQLSGEVSALTGTVSNQVQGVTDSLAVNGTKLDALTETQVVQGETINEIASDVTSAASALAEVDARIEGQSGQVDAIGKQTSETLDLVRTMSESEPVEESETVEQADLEDLLALVPEGASAEIVQYVQYPFIWGMCAGIVGWLISLAIGAVYRLLGFK